MHQSVPASQRLSIILRYSASYADFEDLKFKPYIALCTLSINIIENIELPFLTIHKFDISHRLYDKGD